jgi:lipopolysaccharide assembly outer membrane protein LptD (OstA)
MVHKTTKPISRDSTSRPPRSDRRHLVSPATLLIIAAFIVVSAYQFIIPVSITAQMNSDQTGKTIQDPGLPWQLEADEVAYDHAADEYSATGNVMIYKGNIRLIADYVRLDHKNMKAYAEGNVILTNGEDILSGTSMNIDLNGQIEDYQ